MAEVRQFLKREDLMIGDYVAMTSYENNPEGETSFFQLKEGADIDIADGLYEPISLTKEMFSKNGWTTDDGYAWLKLDEHLDLQFYFHEHRLHKIFEGVDEWENHSNVRDLTFQCNCSYVHQLQHALRMCGHPDLRFVP